MRYSPMETMRDDPSKGGFGPAIRHTVTMTSSCGPEVDTRERSESLGPGTKVAIFGLHGSVLINLSGTPSFSAREINGDEATSQTNWGGCGKPLQPRGRGFRV